MVGQALDVGVFLFDDLSMSNAGVMYVSTHYRVRGRRGGRAMEEVSCHKFPYLFTL